MLAMFVCGQSWGHKPPSDGHPDIACAALSMLLMATPRRIHACMADMQIQPVHDALDLDHEQPCTLAKCLQQCTRQEEFVDKCHTAT